MRLHHPFLTRKLEAIDRRFDDKQDKRQNLPLGRRAARVIDRQRLTQMVGEEVQCSGSVSRVPIQWAFEKSVEFSIEFIGKLNGFSILGKLQKWVVETCLRIKLES